MEIIEDRIDQVTILRLKGRLDSDKIEQLDSKLDGVVASGVKRLLFDMAGVNYVNSSGLRAVLIVGKQMQAANGSLGLFSLTPQVRHVFEIARFSNIFPIYDSEADATIAPDVNS